MNAQSGIIPSNGPDIMQTVRVIDIVRGTTVDGPGFRTSVYFAGCCHKCPDCHNPESWPFDAGSIMTLQQIMEVVREEDFDVTFSGGDPMYHPEQITALSRMIHQENHTVWLFTGFTWEQILSDRRMVQVLPHIDVIVDGPFVRELRDPDLLFRGSSNQRIIDVVASLESGHPELWHSNNSV